MAVRHGADELAVKEQQVETWEEKLTQRAQALADSARSLTSRRSAVSHLQDELQAKGGQALRSVSELLSSEPLAPGLKVSQSRDQAEAARRVAVEARLRAAQAWEEELAQQTLALNQLLAALSEAQETLQRSIEARAEPVMLIQSVAGGEPVIPGPEPIPLVRAKPPPPPPAAKSGPDYRAFQRSRLAVQVDFESDHNFFTGFSADISEGGLFVATVNLQPLGSPIEVAFALPTGEQVVARGRVKWVREASDRDQRVQAGMGIQFEGLSDEARDSVHQFITQRDPIFYEE